MEYRANDYIRWLDTISSEDNYVVGGKCANLGDLIQMGIPVPRGYAITVHAFEDYVQACDLGVHIEEISQSESNESLMTLSQRITSKIELTNVPDTIAEPIQRAQRELAQKVGKKRLLVAVRSSGIAEDLPNASFAGQHETYLAVNEKDLIVMVRACWKSLFSYRVLQYRAALGILDAPLGMAVGVQEMISPAISGVMFTANPVTKDVDEVVIEASWGLGSLVVSGQVTPDIFIVDKNGYKIKEERIGSKAKLESMGTDGRVHVLETPSELAKSSTLTPKRVSELVDLALKIEHHFECPQDIEWLIDAIGQIHILQSRDITTQMTRKII